MLTIQIKTLFFFLKNERHYFIHRYYFGVIWGKLCPSNTSVIAIVSTDHPRCLSHTNQPSLECISCSATLLHHKNRRPLCKIMNALCASRVVMMEKSELTGCKDVRGEFFFLTKAKPKVLKNQIPFTENMKKRKGGGGGGTTYRKCFSLALSHSLTSRQD